MTRKLLHAVAGAALALTLVSCANDGPYADGGSLAYDYGYGGPWDGSYGGYWGPGFYDGGGHYHEWHGSHGGEGWHGGHLAFSGRGGGFGGGHGDFGGGHGGGHGGGGRA